MPDVVPHQQPSAPRLCPWLPWLLGAQVAICAVVWFRAVRQPHGLALDEVQIANLAWFWRHGIVPYFGRDGLPAVFDPYGPLLPWLLGRCGAAGLNVFIAGRVVALLGIGACVSAVALTPRASRRTWFWLLASMVLLLTARPAFTFAMRCRTDAPAVALAVSGFLCCTRSRSRRALVVGIVLLALSTLTKVTSVAAPLAVFLALRRERREDAWSVLLAWAGLVGVGYGALDLLSGGNLLGSLARAPGHLGRAIEMASRPFTLTGLWVVATLVGLRRLPRRERSELTDLAWYGGLSYAVAVVTGAAWGSHWGYLLEFFVVLALAFAQIATRLAARGEREALGTMSWLLAGHLLFAVPYLAVTGMRYVHEGERVGAAVPAARAQLEELLTAGRRVAVIHDAAASSALLSLDRPNLIDVVDLCPLNEAGQATVIQRVMDAGMVDVVLEGPELREWSPPMQREKESAIAARMR